MAIFYGKKKWQSCKDSNLNKVNQNHLCYRYTTGLRIFYFVVLSNITAFRNKASSNFNFFQTFQLKIAYRAAFRAALPLRPMSSQFRSRIARRQARMRSA